MSSIQKIVQFADLNLPAPLLKAVKEVGYEQASPIQAATIPLMLEGYDLIGQAQTGTGKTAAFALPALAHVDIGLNKPQTLVLAPTRELAIQVAEAVNRYARYMKGVRVLPIYGGQSYTQQIRQLDRGTHIVVGTPGRVMDLVRKGKLKLEFLNTLVLDEADEMLRMGFIDDVEWILERTPEKRQVALFSATMPKPIRKIADNYLNQPKEIIIKQKARTADTVSQRFLSVTYKHKMDALTRILEVEDFDAAIIFVRTKVATQEVSDKLVARGYACAEINGDIAQKQREATIEKLRKGRIDILVATDVAARGLDVKRISHVINFDIPHDTESYIHRIGRTGRAGRTGHAILFVGPREKRLLRDLEKAGGSAMERLVLPTTEDINNKRVARFKQNITDTLSARDLTDYREIIDSYQFEHNVSGVDIAAALVSIMQGNKPLLLNEPDYKGEKHRQKEYEQNNNQSTSRIPGKADRLANHPDLEMERFRIEIGKYHKVKPSQIVAAIANDAEIEGQYIGQIKIFNDFSTVDLPAGMPEDIFRVLKKTVVGGNKLSIQRMSVETGKKTKKTKSFRKKKNKNRKSKKR